MSRLNDHRSPDSGRGVGHPLLDLARMEVLRKIRLRPRGAAEGSFAGPHKSNYRGTAVEFADFREYVEGDDIRLVDWKLFARTERYYVRLYEAERNLISYLVVDTSGSMEYAGVRPGESKLARACRLAATAAYLVVREGDEAGLSLAASSVDQHLAPRSSWTHLGSVLNALSAASPAGRTDLGRCLEDVFRRLSRRGVLMVISDFLTDPKSLWRSVDLFRKSFFDVILFHVVHPDEIELPDIPFARFADPEGPSRFSAEPDLVREAYRGRFASFLRSVEGSAKARGVDWHLARTDEDPYIFLERCFLERERSG